jgi:hypothetical protein
MYSLECYYKDQIQKSEMSGACSAHGELRSAYRIFYGKSEGKKPLEELGLDGSLAFKWTVGKQAWTMLI